ncbi:S53 family peptidase [Flexivirga caeni]|nr:S53 family peptidase [Flexivirga caeni]
MKRTLAASAAALTCAALVPAGTALAGPAKPNTVTLNGSGRLANSHVKMGAAATSGTVDLTLQLPLRNQALAQQMAQRGQVVSPARYAQLFAPSQAQVDRVTSWARAKGFQVTSISRSSGQVSAAAPVSKVNSAFGVKMHRATLGTTRGMAVDKAPTVPASLGLSGVAGLNSLHRMQTMNAKQTGSARSTLRPKAAKAPIRAGGLRKLASGYDGSTACADYWGDHLGAKAQKFANESNYLCGYGPGDLATMYGTSAAAKKNAPSLGLLLWGGDTTANVIKNTNQYMKDAGYPAMTKYTSTISKGNAQMADCDPLGSTGEQAIDVQSSHAISPNSPIQYVGAASCYDNDLQSALQKMVDAHKVTTISMSFGTLADTPGTNPDTSLTAADKAAWDRPMLQAHLTGISTFASSGDNGDTSGKDSKGKFLVDGKPHVGYPASSTWTTAVGGTSIGMLTTGAQPVVSGWENNYFLQSDPNKAQFTNITAKVGVGGAGGGLSESWAMPSWQKGKVNGISSTRRAVPDVAGLSDPYTGYTVHFLDHSVGSVQYETYGGTSLGSPIIAAVVALAKANNKLTLGDAAPLFYKLAGTSALIDVNSRGKAGVYFPETKLGNIVVGFDDKPQSLVTAKGWDNVTGVGTPNPKTFIAAFK